MDKELQIYRECVAELMTGDGGHQESSELLQCDLHNSYEHGIVKGIVKGFINGLNNVKLISFILLLQQRMEERK